MYNFFFLPLFTFSPFSLPFSLPFPSFPSLSRLSSSFAYLRTLRTELSFLFFLSFFSFFPSFLFFPPWIPRLHTESVLFPEPHGWRRWDRIEIRVGGLGFCIHPRTWCAPMNGCISGVGELVTRYLAPRFSRACFASPSSPPPHHSPALLSRRGGAGRGIILFER